MHSVLISTFTDIELLLKPEQHSSAYQDVRSIRLAGWLAGRYLALQVDKQRTEWHGKSFEGE